MTDRRSLSPGRLEEIRRLAEIDEAEDRSAQAPTARKRRVFGPLFYSTLVAAVIITSYVGALRVGELVEQQAKQSVTMSPDRVVAANAQQLQHQQWEVRAAAAKAIGTAMLTYGPGDNTKGYRAEALVALRIALADQAAPVRAEAAEALGNCLQLGNMAQGELTTALKDADPTVRLAAARALLRNKDEPPAAALRALADLLTDPTPSSDRLNVLDAMRSQGAEGRDAAAKSLAAMFASRDELLRSAALECMPAMAYDGRELAAALEPLLGGDRETRTYAALAAARLTQEGEKLPPPLISILETAVVDTTLAATLREHSLQELERLSRASLGRSGRELAHQLDHPNYNIRLDAATLLRMIDPEALAEKDRSVEK
jgi:hypothetical protein